MKKILFVLTNNNKLGNTNKETGFYLPEVAHPYEILKNSFKIEFASILGGEAPISGLESISSDSVSKKFYENHSDFYKNTKKLNSLNYEDYDAIFFAGGHGTMWDFPKNEDISNAIVTIYEKGGVIASVCHGPAALVDVKLSNGKYLLSNKKFTSFTNAEEEAINCTNIVPLLLETALINNGGIFEKADLWKRKVIVDSRIITGQNPASAYGVAEELKVLLEN